MKSVKILGLGGLVVLIFTLGACGLVSQVHEMERFAKCDFSVSGMALEKISGVDVSHVKSVSDLSFSDVIVFSRGMLEGKLPAEARFNVEVSNPSGEKAAVSGMDWKLLQKQQVIASGKLEKPVVVKGHGRTAFELNAELNLATILRLNSMDQIMSVVSGNLDSGTLQKLGITIQLKPYYKLGDQVRKYPGYFTITPEDLGQ